jgi:Flp pilus assembly protein TadG
MSVRQLIGRRLRKFRRNEDGAVTVEFVLWLPVFLVILVLIVDTTMIYSAEARLWDAARDAARQMSLYQITEDEVEDYIAANAIGLNGDLTITADDTGPDVWVQISMPMSDVTVFNFYRLMENPIIAARVTQRAEPI